MGKEVSSFGKVLGAILEASTFSLAFCQQPVAAEIISEVLFSANEDFSFWCKSALALVLADAA